ncbi:hypothetical protein H2201_008546 [Coniosporium apollinis]|uniref:Thioredoxin-like fold domain-containing protein n=1 Tax=Coniosporium apollinis TaxID=61459 RepID=A0ABQ9NIN9_9PEZI|nr:hypothetical protein H2201_008546 [Coniosporium apollinis]
MTDFDPAPLEITLFRGWSDKDCYVWSPFVTKLELRLRLSNVSYQTAAGSMRTAPTGKIPYVDVREEEQPTSTTSAIGDSAMIAQYLAGRGLIHDLDANLGASSKAQDLAIRALVEDRLYFFNMRERWMDNFYIQRDHVLTALSYPLRVVGTGRYSADEARRFREDIWTNLNGLLEESWKKAQESSPESKEVVRSLPAVMDYATRIHERYFPDYEKWD